MKTVLAIAMGILVAAGLGLHLRAQTPAAGAAPASPWIASAQYSQGYDSNVTLASAHPAGDTTSQLALELGGQWQGPRWGFESLFTPTGMAYARHSDLDFISEGYQQTVNYAATPHTKLNWALQAQRYPQRGGMPGGLGGGLGAVIAASQGLGQGSVITTGSSSVGLQHQSSLFTTWSANLNASLNAYSPDARFLLLASPLAAAARTRALSYGGGLGWTHQVSEQRSLEVNASDNEIGYSHGGARLRTLNLQGGIDQKLGGPWQLQLLAGPSWTQNLGATSIGSLQGYGYAATAGLTAIVGRSTSGVSWQHSQQASLTPGGIATDVIGLHYAFQWTQSWSLSTGLGYSRTANPARAGVGQLGSSFAAAQLAHKLGSGWWLQAGASFNTEPAALFGESGGNLRRFQANLGIRYQFGGVQ